MEIRFSETALAFEAEVRAFLHAEWGRDRRRASDDNAEAYAEERAFRRKLAERGWLTMSWPAEFGGGERTFEEQYLFQEACNYVGAPIATVAVQQVGPTLMRFGTDQQREHFLPPIARGRGRVRAGVHGARRGHRSRIAAVAGPCATATTSCSTGSSASRRRRIGPSTSGWLPAPIPTSPSIAASRCSWCR